MTTEQDVSRVVDEIRRERGYRDFDLIRTRAWEQARRDERSAWLVRNEWMLWAAAAGLIAAAVWELFVWQ